MHPSNLDEIARTIAKGLHCDHPAFCRQLLHPLANGHPISPDQIGTTLHLSRDQVTATLSHEPDIEFDSNGNVMGKGLTLIPTPHCFQINSHRMFTWCALDALVYPAILQQPARVESTCPITGIKIRLTVTSEGIEHLEPPSTVVSIVVPETGEACRCTRETFCNQGHFFSSPDAASIWLPEHQDAIILPVDEAYQLGRLVAKYRKVLFH